ncbi:hypothetical protein RYX36_018196 [Vicia faba]
MMEAGVHFGHEPRKWNPRMAPFISGKRKVDSVTRAAIRARCHYVNKKWLRGALFPWKIIKLPHGELAAPTNDINTTIALALLMSVAYFYAGISKKGLAYFGKYIQPTPILLPINILEDELVVVVLVSLVPLVVPIPVMFLGLFTSGIQALIFATLAATYIGESMEGHH